MEQYEFITPNNTKFTITSEEVERGWRTTIEVVNKDGEVTKHTWDTPYDSDEEDLAAFWRIVEIVRTNY